MIGSDFWAPSDTGWMTPYSSRFSLFPSLRFSGEGSSPLSPDAVNPPADFFLFRTSSPEPTEAIPPGTERDQSRATSDESARGDIDAELTEEEEKQIEELKQRDAEVRRHEEAHFRAGGRYASTPKYEYQTGPDGKRYAVGGSVDIDTSEIPGDPQATIEKARVIKRAALAPEEPSAQDRRVAREADQMAANAMQAQSEAQTQQLRDRPQPAESPAADPHTAASDTTGDKTVESSPAPSGATPADIPIDRPSAQQSLIRYKTSQLKHYYVPVETRLSEDTHRVPLVDRYV
jgi:hypothetical protein